ncbi:hypothetical protein DYB31_010149 [Aphanomyces astaci]|uniref:Reverse transcriptase domain-containing protein n=1 Tax=Aphanomyces astaci TaxID=112090 RepID=A0A397FE72_APHAT|nr:hypothetical protein DYB31_010149 [Aphanomyces astaci]
MEAPLTANEFYFAITKSARNKAPGPDGLPIEYYLTDPHNWARVFEVCYSNQLQRGRMTKFQRRAHLSLLYKAGERLEPGNHRPLTLLNSDAKLGPKIMSYRLGKTLPTILHEDQHGFVPGRSIQQALFEFTSIQQYCKLNDVASAGAVLLDFAKAFDSVLWEVLDEVLLHFNFGPTFRAWIKTFYNNTLIYILINGKPLDPFELGAGVRQDRRRKCYHSFHGATKPCRAVWLLWQSTSYQTRVTASSWAFSSAQMYPTTVVWTICYPWFISDVFCGDTELEPSMGMLFCFEQ